MSKFSSPLNNVRVASPCPADWNAMYGDEKVRFCGECKLNVYNLSGMSRIEAENLLYSTEGRLCVRYFKRADGSVITQDCPVGWRALKKRVSNLAAAACTMALGVFGAFMFTAPAKEEIAGTAVVENLPVNSYPRAVRAVMGNIDYDPKNVAQGVMANTRVETKGEYVREPEPDDYSRSTALICPTAKDAITPRSINKKKK